MILADVLLSLFQKTQFTLTFDEKVLLSKKVSSGKIHLNYKGGGHGKGNVGGVWQAATSTTNLKVAVIRESYVWALKSIDL